MKEEKKYFSGKFVFFSNDLEKNFILVMPKDYDETSYIKHLHNNLGIGYKYGSMLIEISAQEAFEIVMNDYLGLIPVLKDEEEAQDYFMDLVRDLKNMPNNYSTEEVEDYPKEEERREETSYDKEEGLTKTIKQVINLTEVVLDLLKGLFD